VEGGGANDTISSLTRSTAAASSFTSFLSMLPWPLLIRFSRVINIDLMSSKIDSSSKTGGGASSSGEPTALRARAMISSAVRGFLASASARMDVFTRLNDAALCEGTVKPSDRSIKTNIASAVAKIFMLRKLTVGRR